MNCNLSQERVSLDRLPTGTPAVVVEVDAGDDDTERLKVMGLCEGVPVHNLRNGNRMITCVAGTRLGLTAAVARRVTVAPREQDEPTP